MENSKLQKEGILSREILLWNSVYIGVFIKWENIRAIV